MPTTIKINIPDEIMEGYKSQNEIEREVYVDFILQERQKGKISLGRAAELLDISYNECFDLLGQRGYSIINATREELDENEEDFRQFMEQHQR